MITATGKTFEHRDTIRSFGGYWSGHDKCWKFDRLTPSQLTQLRGLVGVIVTDHGPSVEEPSPSSPSNDGPFVFTGLPSRGTTDTRRKSNIYGDDPTYHNHFADQNSITFFGFSSLGAMVDYLDGQPSSVKNDPRRAGWPDSDAQWSGGLTMAQALAMARQGWPEGAEMAEAVAERLTVANPRVRRRKPSMAGGAVSVGRMLAGDPAHMISRPKQPGSKMITVFVEAGCSGAIDADTLMVRAAIIIAIVDLMENNGYSCNIVATDTSTWRSGGAVYQLAVTLKAAGERLNLNDIAFALGHPAFLRKLSFGTQTTANEIRETWEGLGNPSDAFNEDWPCAKNELYVPVIATNVDEDAPWLLLPHIIPNGLPVDLKID